MGNRKKKPIKFRLLSTLGSFLMLGAIVYILIAGFNLYVGAAIAASILSLGVPSVSAGEGVLEVVLGFFESFLDGIIEVVGGVLDAISSIFN
ncbi:MAG: hypothetical protein AAF402_00810 [Pseudomonadota bacterium]